MLRRCAILTGILVATVALKPAAQAPAAMVLAASGRELPTALARIDDWLADGRLDLTRFQEDTMTAGRLHERLEQRHQGLRVFGGEVVRQIDGRSPVSIFGRVYEGIDIGTTPAIDVAAAAASATTTQGAGAIADPEPELGILPLDDGGYTLVYRVTVRSPEDIHRYDVNARTGVIEAHHSLIQSQATVGRGTGVHGDPKKVSANIVSGTFRSQDVLRPATGYTLNFGGTITRFNAFLSTGTVNLISDLGTDSDNVWSDGAVVDAHVYTGWTGDYLLKRYGRRGIDDANRALIVIVHPLARSLSSQVSPQLRGQYINNAGYFRGGATMYGDGDGILFDFLAGGLDVVAHEMTHGVTEFSSNLGLTNEPGALNEAFSDVMATGAEFFYQPAGAGALRADWLIGEDVTRANPGFIRSMRSPTDAGHPDHYSQRATGLEDSGGVHTNASIVTHAFYLAVAGGTHRLSGIAVQGIGVNNIERMERIFYRGFVFFLGPASQFTDARAATLQAATELFGAASNERAQLLQAWTAVGVN